MTDLTVARRDPTARELELVGHLADGRSNAQIADLMGIATGTVKAHMARISARLALDTGHGSGHLRAAIVMECYRRGLIQ